MRDLLQPGTPLYFPVPGSELEITQREYYTFGGVENAGAEGTASGSNSWMDNAPKVSSKTISSDEKYHPKLMPIEELRVVRTGKTIKHF